MTDTSEAPFDDPLQRRIDELCASGLSLEELLEALEALEPEIEAAHAAGSTRVKPVRLMGPDDLVGS